MSIEYAILGLLSWRSLSGYDLKKMFEGSEALYWSGNNNQIYRALLHLHSKQLVSLEVQHQESGPSRKLYSITAKGAAELKNWVCSAPELPQIKHLFLIQLAWADQLDPAELATLLKRYEEQVHVQLAMAQAQREQQNIAPSGLPRDAYINVSQARTPREAKLWSLIQENWIAFYEHELSWVQKLRQELTNEG